MPKKTIYKIIFHNQDKIYEVYARNVHQSTMFGFIEIEQFVFGEKTSVVVDPSEENLKSEFSNVNRTYIPMHSIIRIDEVDKMGAGKISHASAENGNIMHFPVYTKTSGDSEK